MALNHDQLSDHSILLRYPEVAQLAIDVLTIPASSYDSECSLIELGDLLQSRRDRDVNNQANQAELALYSRWLAWIG
jgi:hypothetical protein